MLRLVQDSRPVRKLGTFIDVSPLDFAIQHQMLDVASRRPVTGYESGGEDSSRMAGRSFGKWLSLHSQQRERQPRNGGKRSSPQGVALAVPTD